MYTIIKPFIRAAVFVGSCIAAVIAWAVAEDRKEQHRNTYNKEQ